MGYKNNDMCLTKAKEDEPIFVLLGRDKNAPKIVREWAAEFQFHNTDLDGNWKSAEKKAKYDEAMAHADKMEKYAASFVK